MRRPEAIFIGTGTLCLASYLAIERLSHQFVVGEGHQERPLVAVLFWLGLAFGGYLLACAVAFRDAKHSAHHTRLARWMLGFALTFRAVLWWSEPIQEIDIYRYVWDGNVVAVGVNPFRYSLSEVAEAESAEGVPADLRKLTHLRRSSPALKTIFARVHYPQVPTVYPTVSQAVFAAVAWLTPGDAPLKWHLLIMKGILLAFDVATVLGLLSILHILGQPLVWAVAYAWCPLVLKEFANSGHLDAITLGLTVWAVRFTLPLLVGASSSSDTPKVWASTSCSVVLLAAACLAKLFPIVLLPLLTRVWWQRLGWRASIPCAAFTVTVLLLAWPMVGASRPRQVPDFPIVVQEALPSAELEELPHGQPKLIDSVQDDESPDKLRGFKVFFSRWEMNDFLFMLLVENLTPDAATPETAVPWFRILPNGWRQSISDAVAARLPRGVEMEPAFLLARLLTGGLFTLLALYWALAPWKGTAPLPFLERVFLTLVWLWLLVPTQNPWYLAWALPWLPWARRKAWFLLSGCALIYYLRFWCDYHLRGVYVWGTLYQGTDFFDFIIVWLEFAPWFLLLAGEAVWQHCRQAKPS